MRSHQYGCFKSHSCFHIRGRISVRDGNSSLDGKLVVCKSGKRRVFRLEFVRPFFRRLDEQVGRVFRPIDEKLILNLYQMDKLRRILVSPVENESGKRPSRNPPRVQNGAEEGQKAREQNIDRTPKRNGRNATEVREPKRNKVWSDDEWKYTQKYILIHNISSQTDLGSFSL